MNTANVGLAGLRHATKNIHASFELELKIASPDATKQDYQIFVQAMWGWLSPFETRLWQSPWPAPVRSLERDGKSAWLLSDLHTMGLTDQDIAALPLARCDLDMSSQASRFGIGYVLEGAQLGSQLLAKRLQPILKPWSARWLVGYGGEVANNWRIFMQSTELHLNDEESNSIAAQSACKTFESLQAWFRETGAA